ncbi:MAG TPA: chloride channel protein [Actinomycetota bacterium]|nr:chloride channel protein [Actinomycetota bacterium]
MRDRVRALPGYESNVLAVTAVFVGVLAGVGAVILELLLRLFGKLFLGAETAVGTDALRVLIAPVVGGLLAGPMIARGAQEAKGHGVPEVMEAVAVKGGRIRGRVAIVKTLASALTIGSGGSAGREGPIVQVGATLGSTAGQLLRMSESRIRLLVACGAAGGISAAFNAPLAGVFFALEIILQRFSARGFATVVLSAVTASVIWRSAFGNQPVLNVPAFGLRNPVELLFYVILGLLAAVAAVAFIRALYWTEDRFDGLRLLEDLKPALGGFLLGLVGLATLELGHGSVAYGSGLPGINLALGGGLVWWVLLALFAAKLAATSLTLGSGASGGVFAPSLFMGAMLGAAFGQGVHALFPGMTAGAGAYAMVGMAAVFAGAAHAPISSILILFEMTNDYRIILPLMLACIVATLTASVLLPDSIYTLKIRRKGVELTEGRERHLLERTPVSRATLPDVVTVPSPTTLERARRLMQEQATDRLLVVADGDRLVGVLRAERLADTDDRTGDDPVDDLVEDYPVVTPQESIDDALRKLAPRGLPMVPVVADQATRRVIGLVTRDSLLTAYWNALGAEREGGRHGA